MRMICALVMCLAFVGQTAADEVPKQVLAFYYPWYGSPEHSGRWIHWSNVEPDKQAIASSTNYPVIGAYDSTDPELIDRHMRQMAEVGIDGVISSWWGRGAKRDNLALERILDSAHQHGRVVTVYHETILGPDLERYAADDFIYLIERFAKHPAWQKVDGRPDLRLRPRGRTDGGFRALEHGSRTGQAEDRRRSLPGGRSDFDGCRRGV